MATTPRARSVSSFIWILVLAVIGTAIFAGGAGYAAGAGDLAGKFSPDQIQFIDGLVYGTQIKSEWLAMNPDKQASSEEARIYSTQRCAGKFFPDQPVAMKGCIAAQDPRPPEGYQYQSK